MNNILVVNFITTIGGIQSVYKNLLPALAKKHHLFFLDPYNNQFKNCFNKIPNIDIVDLKINTVSSLGWQSNKLNKIFLLCRHGPVYFLYFFKVMLFVKRKKIDLLYVSGAKEMLLAYIIKKFLRIKYVYHSHGFYSYKDINIIQKSLINNSEIVIAVSLHVKKTLIRAGVANHKIIIAYNAIDANELQKLNQVKLQKKSKTFKVIYIGSIQPKKGIHILIKAVNSLFLKEFDMSLSIVGAVPHESYFAYKKYLLDLTKEVKPNKIKFINFVTNVYPFICESDVLVLPSTEESFGLVLLEAMLCCKPVIGTKIGGIPEVIINDCNGFLFKPYDEYDLATKLIALYLNKDLCKMFGLNGQALALQKFSTEKQADIILDAIRQKCERHSKTSN